MNPKPSSSFAENFAKFCSSYWKFLDKPLSRVQKGKRPLWKAGITTLLLTVCLLKLGSCGSQSPSPDTTAVAPPASTPAPVSSAAAPQTTPVAALSVTPTPTAASLLGLPKATCGDRPSAKGNDTWYPVFIDDGDLQEIRTQYCADAVATTRKDTGVKSVQLASFTDRSRAQQFAQAVKGDVGAPSYPEVGEEPEQIEPGEEPVAAVEQNSCDPAYPGICIPANSADLDCGDISYKGFQVLSPDPHRFDRDNDGIGCES